MMFLKNRPVVVLIANEGNFASSWHILFLAVKTFEKHPISQSLERESRICCSLPANCVDNTPYFTWQLKNNHGAFSY